MKNDQNLSLAKKLLKSYSIETTPNVYNKYGQFSDIVNKTNSIYITYLPDEESIKVIDAAKKLKIEGFDVIPHLPARTIKNNIELENYIKQLAEVCGCSKILIVGNIFSAVLTITPFFAIFLYYKNFELITIIYALLLFFIILAKDIIKDLENLKGDFILNYKTIAVVYGEKFAKVVISIIILISYINVINLILNFDIGLMFYYYYFCLFIFACVLIILWKYRTKKSYLIIHNIMRALIILGIFSIVLI